MKMAAVPDDNVLRFPSAVAEDGILKSARKLRHLLGARGPEDFVEAREAVGHFLDSMAGVAARLYPAWSRILNDGFSDCSLNYDERRSLFELHPIDDYFFAAVVALDASRLRSLYTPREAEELLSEIGEQVDLRAGRQDRVVSDLVFQMIGRIDLGASTAGMKAPYDTVVKAILLQIGVHRIEATKDLIRDVGFRHLLGEPLALNVPQWWRAFQTKFRITWKEPEPVYLSGDDITPVVAPPAPPRRRVLRRRINRLPPAAVIHYSCARGLGFQPY